VATVAIYVDSDASAAMFMEDSGRMIRTGLLVSSVRRFNAISAGAVCGDMRGIAYLSTVPPALISAPIPSPS